MIIYIPIELYTREIDGWLLFSANAKKKGIKVILLSGNSLWLFHRLSILNKGVIIEKNLNITNDSIKNLESYKMKGHQIFVQEQEPSILWSNFNDFLESRAINSDQYFPFKKIFCWGDRDYNLYRKIFRLKKDCFIKTGSPRAEIWQNYYDSIFSKNNDLKKKEKYILFVSNFGWLMSDMGVGKRYLSHSKLGLLNSTQQQDNLLSFVQEDNHICIEFIKFINKLSKLDLKYKLVIKPHPLDDHNQWQSFFTNSKNVIIAKKNSNLSQLIVDADFIIHNGCTSAIESFIKGKSVFTYGSERLEGKIDIPNKISEKIVDVNDLVNKISILESSILNQEHNKLNLINELIFLNGKNHSSNLMLNEILKDMSINDLKINNKLKIFLCFFASYLKSIADKFRVYIFKNFNNNEIIFDEDDIQKKLTKICAINDLSKPKVKIINKRVVLIN